MAENKGEATTLCFKTDLKEAGGRLTKQTFFQLAAVLAPRQGDQRNVIEMRKKPFENRGCYFLLHFYKCKDQCFQKTEVERKKITLSADPA